MPIKFEGQVIQGISVANCNEISARINELINEINKISKAEPAVIETFYNKLTDKLKRQEAEKLLIEAQRKSGQELRQLAGKAIAATSDMLLIFAVKTRNPTLIGASLGFDLVVDSTHWIMQFIQAKNSTDTKEAIVQVMKDQYSSITTLISGSEKQISVGKIMASAIKILAEAVLDEIQLKAQLKKAQDELNRIDASLPKNLDETRKYMLGMLETEKFILSILFNEYSSKDCRVNTIDNPPR